MDCNYTNQRRAQLGCPQFTAVAQCCGCHPGVPPMRPPVNEPLVPPMPQPRQMENIQRQPVDMAPSGFMTDAGTEVCTNTTPGGMESYPLAMAYVPWQQWKQTYTLDQALQRGTIFPELDLPFEMGRCR